MEYILSEKQIDKLLKSFFDKQFSNTVLRTHKEPLEQEWHGFYRDEKGKGKILLGYPVEDTTSNWFSDGQYFQGWWKVFNLSHEDFQEAMRRYINKNYNLKIPKIY